MNKFDGVLFSRVKAVSRAAIAIEKSTGPSTGTIYSWLQSAISNDPRLMPNVSIPYAPGQKSEPYPYVREQIPPTADEGWQVVIAKGDKLFVLGFTVQDFGVTLSTDAPRETVQVYKGIGEFVAPMEMTDVDKAAVALQVAKHEAIAKAIPDTAAGVHGSLNEFQSEVREAVTADSRYKTKDKTGQGLSYSYSYVTDILVNGPNNFTAIVQFDGDLYRQDFTVNDNGDVVLKVGDLVPTEILYKSDTEMEYSKREDVVKADAKCSKCGEAMKDGKCAKCDETVKKSAPILFGGIFQRVSTMRVMAAEAIAKGDTPGHAFRGNQWTTGEAGGGGVTSSKEFTDAKGDVRVKLTSTDSQGGKVELDVKRATMDAIKNGSFKVNKELKPSKWKPEELDNNAPPSEFWQVNGYVPVKGIRGPNGEKNDAVEKLHVNQAYLIASAWKNIRQARDFDPSSVIHKALLYKADQKVKAVADLGSQITKLVKTGTSVAKSMSQDDIQEWLDESGEDFTSEEIEEILGQLDE